MSQNNEIIDTETNLLALGNDAWDDTAIIQSFDDNIQYFAKKHSDKITDMSKVPSMISNLNLNTNKKNNSSEIILEPSFYPYSNENDNDNDNTSNNNNSNNNYNNNNNNDIHNINITKNTGTNKFIAYPPKKNSSEINLKKEYELQEQKKQNNQINNINENNNNETNYPSYIHPGKQQNQQQSHSHPQHQPYPAYPPSYPSYPPPNPYHYPGPPHPHYPHHYNAYYQPPNYHQSHHHYPYYPPQHTPYESPRKNNPYPGKPDIPQELLHGINILPPPTRTGNKTRDDALANMLLAWFWSGYHAGYQQGIKNKK